MGITTAQIRAARGILNWSQGDLADKTGISATSIGSIEKGQSQPRESTLGAIQSAFENAGLEFLPGSGVRMKDEMIDIWEGSEALDSLLDDIYKTLMDKGGVVSLFGVEEHTNEDTEENRKLKAHIERLEDANITERIILRKGDRNMLAKPDWYRWIPEQYFSPYPFILYENKLAMLNWGPPVRVLIIDSTLYASTFKKIFDFLWEKADNHPD
jgi:transcriptional regulator with XRE-family HTH domain